MAEGRRMTAGQVVDKVMGSEHVDVVRESVAWLVGELMEAEVAAQIGAELGEVTAVTAGQVVDKVMCSEHVDVVRESVAWLVGELMEAEVAAQIGAELGEVTAERVTHRNGYRP